MQLDKKKLKEQGKSLVSSTKEAVTITAPVYAGAVIHHVAQQPELAQTVGYATVPWALGYAGYKYVKGKKNKK